MDVQRSAFQAKIGIQRNGRELAHYHRDEVGLLEVLGGIVSNGQ